MPSGPPAEGVGAAMVELLARRAAELDAGARPVGWKIGINVPALQAHFGLPGPVVGYLTDATVLAPGAPIPIGDWVHPALEVEVALRVGPGGGGVSALAPALELVDLDLPFERIGPIVAGNVLHRGVIFGPETEGRVDGVDPGELHGLAVDVRRQGGTDVLASGRLTERPTVTVDVVRSFLADHGATLLPGDRIIAGTLISPLPVAPGDRFDVSFGVLGSLAVSFT